MFTTAGAGSARLACRTETSEDQQVRLKASLGIYMGLADGDTFTGENAVPQENLAIDCQRVAAVEPDGLKPGTHDAGGCSSAVCSG